MKTSLTETCALTSAENDTFVCAVRGTRHPNAEAVETYDGRLISQAEADDNWFVCEDSSELHPNSDLREVRNSDGERRYVCLRVRNSDYQVCSYYSEWFPAECGQVVANDYGWVSQRALDESGRFFICDDCGERYHNDDYAENGVCNSCYEETHSESRGLRSYCDRNYPPPLGKNPLRYGVELEVEVQNSDIDDEVDIAADLLGDDFVIFKGDGSLNNGFEIVTAPADFDIHMQRWDNFFKSRSSYIRSWDPGTCGMHVHVSRSELSYLQLGKMLVFVNRPEHGELIKFLAGRTGERWAKRSPKKIGDGRKFGDERYSAINTLNKNTVEFRIFRGTLNPHRFKANIQFVDALVRFTAPGSRSVADSTDKDAFLLWLRGERRRYKELCDRLVVAGFMPAFKSKPGAEAPVLQSDSD